MRVCNVPLSQPFLRTVISALVEGRLVSGFDARGEAGRLADVTLYLPTSRACRLARAVFLDVLGSDAAVLPRIVALGEIDEDELIFAEAAIGAPALDLLPKISALERRLLLANLIAQWARVLKPPPGEPPLVVAGPASALALADDLARLIDDMITRQVDWRELTTLVPEEHDAYWQLTLKFLKIASTEWPALLAVHGRIEAAERRDRLIAAEAARLQRSHRGPVIAAGSTGSMPATADFLKAIAMLPDGAVVLPGLDMTLDDAAWDAIGSADNGDAAAPSHPQFSLHALLDHFGLRRADVEPLASPSAEGRDLLVSEAMRPAASTAVWRQRLTDPEVVASFAKAMDGVAVAFAANAEMEALTIAVAMREAFEQGKSAALVTPDRALARRVMAALGRWNLPFEDSGGEPLLETSAGHFARLVADALAQQLAPPALLAMLKHPLFRLGRAEGGLSHAMEALELAVLRGTRPPPGSVGVQRAFLAFRAELAKFDRGEASLLHRRDPKVRIDKTLLDEVSTLIMALQSACAPLETGGAGDLRAFASAHRAVTAALSMDEQGYPIAFSNRDGDLLAAAFTEINAESSATLRVSLADYPDVFAAVLSDRTLRRPEMPSAPLRILGTIEARLTRHDRVILGGLIEGVWPPGSRGDPWLNRPMRQALKLDLPERRIGLSAHDFAELMNAPEVILTCAAKVSGAPAVPSRFLHRLEAVAGEELWSSAERRGARYLAFARALDRPAGPPKPCEQPQPKPPRALRPMRLSVTEIETWLRDPYSIYARHILHLDPLDPVDQPLGAADRGSAIHNAIGEYTTDHARQLPADPFAALRDAGVAHFAPLADHPEAKALWWPRFLRIAAWFARWDRDRRQGLRDLHGEIDGRLEIAIRDHTFTLTGRADRIERRANGSYALLDYKTGTPPSNKQVRLGLSPQLTLEAAMLRHGAFDEIDAGASVSRLIYVRLSGANPPGKEYPIDLNDKNTPMTPDDAAEYAREQLEKLILRFDDDAEPYKSLNLPMWTKRYGDYDDLARIKEWSIELEDEE